MIDIHANITPFVGVNDFSLYTSYDELKTKIKGGKIRHNDQIKRIEQKAWGKMDIFQDNKSKYEVISLHFAKDKLVKITLWEEFAGKLPNGIYVGMDFATAKKIDPGLKQDEDWDELFESPDGYWIEYSNGNLKIICITIFIKEIDDIDFDNYRWK